MFFIIHVIHTVARRAPSRFIAKYRPVATLLILTRLGPNDCISKTTAITRNTCYHVVIGNGQGTVSLTVFTALVDSSSYNPIGQYLHVIATSTEYLTQHAIGWFLGKKVNTLPIDIDLWPPC